MSYYLYRLLAALPLPVLYALSSMAFYWVYFIFRYRRTTVKANLRRAFPNQDDQWLLLTERAFYRQFLDTTVEIIHAHQWSLADVREHITMENPELLQEASAGGTQSVIVLTLHQGNWEWMLHSVTAELGYPIDPVYKPLHDLGADRFAAETRSKFGSSPIPMKQAARNILKHRRSFRLFTMVADQSPGAQERALWVPFLNQTTAFYTGAAVIARTTGFPVVFARCKRIHRGQYRFRLEWIARDPKALTDSDIIGRYVQACEEAINASPESWLWSNRRWKRQRRDEDQHFTPPQSSQNHPADKRSE
jgi:KDO2-lipid IV(A) lauroyltransferase